MLPDRSEEDLIRRAQRSETEALACLYESHAGQVYRYLSNRLAQPADAEDVTAEVFLRAMLALPSFEIRDAPFRAWLLRIAHNLAVNHLKKQSRRREVGLLDERAPSGEDPAELALQQANFEEVSSVMGNLTDLQRQVIEFRFLRQLTVAETADHMSRSESAVKFLQYSAIRALRRRLSGIETDIDGSDL